MKTFCTQRMLFHKIRVAYALPFLLSFYLPLFFSKSVCARCVCVCVHIVCVRVCVHARAQVRMHVCSPTHAVTCR